MTKDISKSRIFYTDEEGDKCLSYVSLDEALIDGLSELDLKTVMIQVMLELADELHSYALRYDYGDPECPSYHYRDDKARHVGISASCGHLRYLIYGDKLEERLLDKAIQMGLLNDKDTTEWQERANEDDQYPAPIQGVNLSLDHLKLIKTGVLAREKFSDISESIGKSHSYMHGLISNTHQKYNEFKNWLHTIMEEVHHPSLPLTRRYMNIMEGSDGGRFVPEERPMTSDQQPEIDRLTNCVNDLSFKLGQSRRKINDLEGSLEHARGLLRGDVNISSRLMKVESLLIDMMIEKADK